MTPLHRHENQPLSEGESPEETLLNDSATTLYTTIGPAEAPPFVSVIMPARNEERFIGRAIDALEGQAYPRHRFEIIVADNGSTDATVSLATELGARALIEPGVRVGELRNRAAKLASGEILAFLDADCVAPRDWIGEAVKELLHPGVGAVGGGCSAPEDGTWVETAWTGQPSPITLDVEALAASSFVISRAVFQKVGGFDPLLIAGEDDDLSHRVREAGYTLRSTPACGVIHLGYPRTLHRVFGRQIWHGRSQLQVTHGRMDRLLLLTHVFLFSLAAVLASALMSGSSEMTIIALAINIGCASLAALSRRPKSLLHGVQLLAILWMFLLGRSLGLILSYYDLARSYGPTRVKTPSKNQEE